MALLKTTEDIQKYVRANSVLQTTSYAPYVNDAMNKYMNDVLSPALMAELSSYNDDPDTYDAPDGTETKDALAALLPYAESALVAFTLFIASPFMDLQITEAGLGVISNQNLAPASKDRVAKYDNALEQLGWNRIESLLAFLEENETDYPTWLTSPGYTLLENSFFRSAIDFDDNGFDIDKSRLTFKKWHNTIIQEGILRIEPAISKELSDEIKAEIEDSIVTDVNQLLVPFIKRALANFVAAIHIDKKYFLIGQEFITEVKRILDANPGNYPLYQNSDIYIANRTAYNLYDNDPSSGIVVLGNF